jgi:lysophospholipase L1-like esterase
VTTGLEASDWRRHHVFADSDFTFDPELIWSPVAGRGVFNVQGFRGRAVTGPKAPGLLRILAVGDSNTLGHKGEQGANWPQLLESLDGRLAVLNAGVYGYSSFQGVRRLEQFLPHAPDLALISFGGNDAHPVRVPDAEFASRLARRRGLLKAMTVSRVGQLLVDAAEKIETRRDAGRAIVRRVSLDEYRGNLALMIRRCRERNTVPVLLTRPFYGHTHDPASWKSFGPDYNQATREVGASLGVPVVDVYKQFKRTARVFDDESHFTREGHWEAAQFVYSEIRALLPPPPAP